ncbi:hypothetical protein C1X99_30535, partial [Pseudomonas sp. FW306-02-H06B]
MSDELSVKQAFAHLLALSRDDLTAKGVGRPLVLAVENRLRQPIGEGVARYGTIPATCPPLP